MYSLWERLIIETCPVWDKHMSVLHVRKETTGTELMKVVSAAERSTFICPVVHGDRK